MFGVCLRAHKAALVVGRSDTQRVRGQTKVTPAIAATDILTEEAKASSGKSEGAVFLLVASITTRKEAERMFTRTERLLAGGVLFMAAVAMVTAFPSTARAEIYCNWNLECDWTDEENPGAGKTCEIISYHCSPFSGDCDAACDAENADCIWECESDNGTHCVQACNPVYIACIGACIPWL